MNMAEQMGIAYPATTEQRQRGMVAMLKKARNAHQRFAHDPKLKRRQRLWQRELAAQADAAIARIVEGR